MVSVEGRRQLRSATSRTCIVRRTYSNYWDKCFAAAGRSCATAFQLICDKMTLTFNDLNGHWRHFCSVAKIAAHCDYLLKLRLKSFLTYLLTYLIIMKIILVVAAPCRPRWGSSKRYPDPLAGADGDWLPLPLLNPQSSQCREAAKHVLICIVPQNALHIVRSSAKLEPLGSFVFTALPDH